MSVNVLGGALEFTSVIDDKQFQQSIKQMENRLQDVAKNTSKNVGDLDSLASKAGLAMTAYFSGAAIKNFITDIVKVRGEFQQLDVAFTTILKSKEKANQLTQEIVELAAKTPFSLQEAATGAKQLLAYGFSAESVTDNLRMLGNVASGVGAPLGDIVYLYGTLQTQGRAFTKDIMQFTGRGIPIIAQLAKQFGVSKEEVSGLVEAGKVGFPEIEKAFKSMTNEGGMFFNLMEEQSKTITGQISNLGDAWDKMLNSIGQQNEGVISDVIGGLNTLVENYETVGKVLLFLISTYGTYRAALIFMATAQKLVAASSVATLYLEMARNLGQVTLATRAQAVALGVQSRAQAILNATTLANPYILLATAVVGATVAIWALWDSTTAQEKAQKQLNEQEQKRKEDIDEIKSKTSELNAVINDSNSTDLQRLESYKQLQSIYPKLLSNLSLQDYITKLATKSQKAFNQEIDGMKLDRLGNDLKSYQVEANRLSDALNSLSGVPYSGQAYSDLRELLEIQETKIVTTKKEIERIKQLEWEANTPAEEKLKTYEKQIESLKSQRVQLEYNISKIKESGGHAFDFRMILENTNLSNVNKQLDELISKQKSLTGGAGNEVVKNKAYWEKVKKDAEDAIAAEDNSSKNFLKVKAEQQAIIDKAQREIDKYSDNRKRQTKDETKAQKGYNSVLSEQQSLIASINKLKRDSYQSGLVNEQSDLDKINEKYDEVLKKVVDFNKKAPRSLKIDVKQINVAREAELQNSVYRTNVENYKVSLDDQLAVFEAFEAAKQNIGEAAARKIYDAQLGGQRSYLDMLEEEEMKIISAQSYKSKLTLEQTLKLQELEKRIAEEKKKIAADELKLEEETLGQVLQLTITYNDQRFIIEQTFQNNVKALKKLYTGKELEDRIKILTDQKNEELKIVEDNVIRQSELYKKLGQDTIGYSKDQLIRLADDLQKQLNTGTFIDAEGKVKAITPEIKKDLEGYIAQLKDAIGLTNDLKAAEIIDSLSNGFGSIANVVSGLNEQIGETLQLMSSIGSGVSSAIKSLNAFNEAKKTGDKAGQITAGLGIAGAAVGIISGVVSFFRKQREEREKQKREIEDFNKGILLGEFAINEKYRERLLLQSKINKLKIEGIASELDALEKNKQSVIEDYTRILSLIQKETFKAGYKQIFTGIGFIEIEDIQSLANKSYEELEKLFLNGQLEGKAKELFQTLQKLKEEGFDIDKALEENKQKAKELFTGTTSESIADAIISGFENGYRSASDFADNFQSLMEKAMLNSLKYKYLEGPLQDFFNQFASASQSDTQLTTAEIESLRSMYNKIIENASTQFEQLQSIAGINLNGNSSSGNSLKGAIKGMTEAQAELLAGQFGGLRMTAIDQLNIAKAGFQTLQLIEANTARLLPMYDLLRRIEINGLKVI